MSSENGVINTLFERMEKFLRTETVVGESFQVGSITMIPIITVSFGVAAGEGNGKDNKGNDGNGYGGGVGCKITPNAMLVIKNDEVSVVPLTSRGSLERIVEMVPEIISKMDCCKAKVSPEAGAEE
ncbi:MAG: spore germination protein GerW family protein [Bacillota bacterium]|nr:spore germination protein GerW family protein [Bacillota bacterium]